MIENEIKITECKNLTSAPIYEKNPFMDIMIGELKIKHKTQMVKSKDKNTSIMLINNDGESIGHSAFMRQTQVDEDKFTKLYLNKMGLIWDLKKTSLKVLGYIISILKINDDRIYFDMKGCLIHCNWSRAQSVYDGLLPLINCGIIARTDRNNCFYINPTVVFNGSRITFMDTYIKVSSKESDYHQNSLPENNNFLNEEKDAI
jgi:hypothetical protein